MRCMGRVRMSGVYARRPELPRPDGCLPAQDTPDILMLPSRSYILTSRRAADRRDVGGMQSRSPRPSIKVAMSCSCSTAAALNQARQGSTGSPASEVSGQDNGEGDPQPGRQRIDGAWADRRGPAPIVPVKSH
jgi:hypothetical protein